MALTYSYIPATLSYSVVANSCTAGVVVIPSTYDDGINGVRAVTSIGENAFNSCTSLTSITIPNSVTSIGSGAFSECTTLSFVSLGTGLISLGNSAFSFCYDLATITLPSSLMSIGDECFIESGITAISIPNSVTYLGAGAFSSCLDLSVVVIGTGVPSISANTFAYCGFTSITIPSSVLLIDSTAFYICLNLTTIDVNSSNPNYISVDGVLFSKDITTLITYPAGKAGSYIIPSSVTSISNYAFSNCSGLTGGITISNNVTSIGQNAFEACNLISVIIGNSVTSIESSTFYNCTALTSVTIGNGVTSIGNSAFNFCINLISINIPNEVTSIGGFAFYNCNKLTSLVIPNKVTSIGNSAFSSCAGLTSINIPNGVTSIQDSTFFGCTGLTSFFIPNNITSIGTYAFYNCNKLTSLVIPNKVTSIGQNAFESCALLTRINFLGNAPTLGTNVFSNTNVNLKVYRYSKKSGWSSTFGGEDVLLIDSPATGLETFGFGANSLGQASVKKTNVGSGRLTLSKFDPRNISNIESWTSQNNLSSTNSYNISYVEYFASYSGNDIDTVYYADDDTYTSYTGESFGFTISYSQAQGVWFLYDPNISADIAYAENLLAGSWFTYGDLEYFDVYTWDNDSLSSTDLIQFTWPDISGKSNNLITRPNPTIVGVSTNNLNNLQRKILNNATFRTNSTINSMNPFTIYIVLSDAYTGSNTRKIFGMDSFPNGGPNTYSQLYLESTSSGTNHIFTLKFVNIISGTGSTITICSFTVDKSLFASDTYGPSILKLSSTYNTTSGSPVRSMTLNYYNKYSDINKTLGSLSASGLFTLNIPDQLLYLGYWNFGSNSITPTNWLYLSEFIMYSKFLNNEEDGSITRYLQRKYYGKILS